MYRCLTIENISGHQPPLRSLCTRSGDPCILPFLYSGITWHCFASPDIFLHHLTFFCITWHIFLPHLTFFCLTWHDMTFYRMIYLNISPPSAYHQALSKQSEEYLHYENHKFQSEILKSPFVLRFLAPRMCSGEQNFYYKHFYTKSWNQSVTVRTLSFFLNFSISPGDSFAITLFLKIIPGIYSLALFLCYQESPLVTVFVFEIILRIHSLSLFQESPLQVPWCASSVTSTGEMESWSYCWECWY